MPWRRSPEISVEPTGTCAEVRLTAGSNPFVPGNAAGASALSEHPIIVKA